MASSALPTVGGLRPSGAYNNHDDDDSILSSSSSSSDSSSDDEFLTTTGSGAHRSRGLHGVGGGTGALNTHHHQDREALIRKKLLESFYGSSSPTATGGVATATATATATTERSPRHPTTTTTASTSTTKAPSRPRHLDPSTVAIPPDATGRGGPPESSASNDLDSPSFDAHSHTLSRVAHSTVRSLLETDEALALDVRSLDSTMQTLVYENYSRFIDATDAIRSIGMSVDASESGLARLTTAIDRIERVTAKVDANLRSGRDAVAEKLRVRNLLTRLDALLRLPATLREQIDSGKYRLAAKSHRGAAAILSRHSEGFESLRTIEVECDVILGNMARDLRRKLLLWGGGAAGGRRRGYNAWNSSRHMAVFATDRVDEEKEGCGGPTTPNDDGDADDDVLSDPPPPPSTIAEIFETAGTLLLLASTPFDSGLTELECRSYALASCGQFLESSLDDVVGEDPSGGADGAGAAVPCVAESIVPIKFLDGMLEAATLYGVSFAPDEESSSRRMDVVDDDAGGRQQDNRLLTDFVTEMFGIFLSQVRMALLERSLRDVDEEKEQDAAGVIDGSTGSDVDVEEEDLASADVSRALAHLLRLVRELASGLALPEVGLDVEVASSLVDQAVEVTESMVRRRVAQKFHGLRARVVRECLSPFARDAASGATAAGAVRTTGPSPSLGVSTTTAEGSPAATVPPVAVSATQQRGVVDVVQLASVALSDAMQLVDDMIRGVLLRGEVLGSAAAPVDSAMVKLAVRRNSRKFALWLASTLEILAGCEPDDARITLEVYDEGSVNKKGDPFASETGTQPQGEHDDALATSGPAGPTTLNDSSQSLDGRGDFHGDEDDEASMLVYELVSYLEDDVPPTVYSDLTLAIAEICRLAERSVAETMNQSIAASDKEEAKAITKVIGVFSTDVKSDRARKESVDSDGVVSNRFKKAASRILVLYATNRGGDAAAAACSGLFASAGLVSQNPIPLAPRDAAWRLLEVAKLASIDCANVFGGERMACPAPVFPDDDDVNDGAVTFPPHLTHNRGTATIQGLQLDVERIFSERVQVYAHPSQLVEFTRNAVVAIVLKVAFKALVEQSRVCNFTASGYRQMQVDVALLRHMIPHYVKDDSMVADGANDFTSLNNLLDDIVLHAGQRCMDLEYVGVDEYYDSARRETVTPLSIAQAFMKSLKEDENEETMAKFIIRNE